MPRTPDLIALLESALRADGYDGLYADDGECACLVGDLAPCSEPSPHCRAGYKVDGCHDECGLGCDFHIAPMETE